jgi:hypothetical protein
MVILILAGWREFENEDEDDDEVDAKNDYLDRFLNPGGSKN